MNFLHDKQIKKYFLFLAGFILVLFLFEIGFIAIQSSMIRTLFLTHDNAVVTSLLDQGVSKDMIASAIANREGSTKGADFLAAIGRTEKTIPRLLPFVALFQHTAGYFALIMGMILSALLFTGTILFFRKRDLLYQQAASVISDYIDGDYSRHMPQMNEGTIYQLFASIDELAAMLQAKSESGRKAKEFLKGTISDISHQLKTPLAALTMYQEIIENEPDHPDTVKKFSEKIGSSLRRMEQLILSMLKITRLDVGNIVFEKEAYQISELIFRSISELTTRANNEKKEILLEGSSDEMLICDMEWTSEAVGNIVKNALDHTDAGGTIHISWNRSPYMVRIIITDNGSGILPEDIHHIFKRFYRSKNSMDTQGIGLGLPLAKLIIEGQGGTISVQSTVDEGTAFTISLLTKS